MMARPQTKPMIYHNNSTSLDDLDDHMLTEILCRLPSCVAVLTCTPVNKRWWSLIYDPKFAIHLSNHKKEASASCPDINDDEPPWTFIATLERFGTQLKVWNASSNRSIFASSKFSLNFLPHAINIEATFKDLVLCSDQRSYPKGGRGYYLCNPFTKKWFTLPPCPCSLEKLGTKAWTCLICEQRDDYTRDYKFRVVVLRPSPPTPANVMTHEYIRQKFELRNPKIYKLLVYCSEIDEWKKIKLSVALRPELVQSWTYDRPSVEGCVVCNSIVYINHESCLAGFDPFDVNETCDTTINARVMPTLPAYGHLVESAGKLFVMCKAETQNFLPFMRFEKVGKDHRLQFIVWKLDLNQLPLKWTTMFQGSCTYNDDFGFGPNNHIVIHDSRMHPNNDKLIYMYLGFSTGRYQFVLCDTRSGRIKPLKSLTGWELRGFCKYNTLQRLELPLRPTSIPTTPSRLGMAMDQIPTINPLLGRVQWNEFPDPIQNILF